MNRENRNAQSGDFGLAIMLGILACWFFGFVDTGVALACIVCALSIVTLVRCIENRAVLPVVAIGTLVATCLMVFSVALVDLFMLEVQTHRRLVATEAHFRAVLSELQAQPARERASRLEMVSGSQERTAAFGGVIDAAIMARHAQ